MGTVSPIFNGEKKASVLGFVQICRDQLGSRGIQQNQNCSFSCCSKWCFISDRKQRVLGNWDDDFHWISISFPIEVFEMQSMQLNLLNKSNLTEGKTVGQKVALILQLSAASWLPCWGFVAYPYIYIYVFIPLFKKTTCSIDIISITYKVSCRHFADINWSCLTTWWVSSRQRSWPGPEKEPGQAMGWVHEYPDDTEGTYVVDVEWVYNVYIPHFESCIIESYMKLYLQKQIYCV